MRVIAGVFGGRKLEAVPSKSTRPTTDRVREAWASTVENLLPNGFEGASVLDAFAGSGALGIEALSRGAQQVVFCENNHRALATLRNNLKTLGLDDEARAQGTNIDSLKPKTIEILAQKGPFDLVILDPPYDTPPAKIEALLTSLAQEGGLSKGCLISYERPAAAKTHAFDQNLNSPQKAHTSFILEAQKKYGTIALDYLRYCAP
ncbi:MAG: 16S rRNA (guanine(966)-N(2))-methyltransferase RsmD [Coriobacteriales bacterium]|jgi:16S rRNA (guanine966-N2)-methyltransferase|nr:16S rRNA (guanine(966)-N(2))-methyltransferase RsmD [Coriobacteriales bacterium]